MATIRWLNAIDGDFGAAADWSTGTVPGIDDNVILGVDDRRRYDVTVSTDETVRNLSTAPNAHLTVTAGFFSAGGSHNVIDNKGSIISNVLAGTGGLTLLGGLVNEAGGIIDAKGSGTLTINAGQNTIVNAGLIEATRIGKGRIRGAVDNTGILEVTHRGTLQFDGAVTGDGSVVVDRGTMVFKSTFAENVTLDAGVLELDQSQSYTGIVTGFGSTAGTVLDLRDIGFIGDGEVTFSVVGGRLSMDVSDGTHTAHILLSNALFETPLVASDGHGGTDVVNRLQDASSRHQFVAAMAGMGGSAGGAVHTVHAAPVHEPMLSKPRAMIA